MTLAATSPTNTTDTAAFVQWLLRRGRDPGTARSYASHVQRAFAKGPQGPSKRLLDAKLAPKTKRVVLAALRAWARFQKDLDLLEQLSDIKLPSPVRKTPRKPMTQRDYEDLLDTIASSRDLTSPMRAVLTLIATRGFRVGDVLRLRRSEIQDALKTGVLTYEAKGGRYLEFGARLIREPLEGLLEDDRPWGTVADLISPNAAEETRQQSAVRAVERALSEVGGEDLYPHRLRRTVATLFLEKVGGDIVKLQSWMGWSNIATASGYVDHSRREELDKIGAELVERRGRGGNGGGRRKRR